MHLPSSEYAAMAATRFLVAFWKPVHRHATPSLHLDLPPFMPANPPTLSLTHRRSVVPSALSIPIHPMHPSCPVRNQPTVQSTSHVRTFPACLPRPVLCNTFCRHQPNPSAQRYRAVAVSCSRVSFHARMMKARQARWQGHERGLRSPVGQILKVLGRAEQGGRRYAMHHNR